MKKTILGKVFIVSAPSGTGKSSLLRALAKKIQRNTKFSISYTTRKIRPKETNAKNYFFVSVEEFQRMIRRNDFLEYASIFGNYYGTPKRFVEDNIKLGFDVILEIDWIGTKKVLKEIPSSKSIFILPPCKKTLRKRLLDRKQDDRESIQFRMQNVVKEIKNCPKYHYIVINDNFDSALQDLHSIITSEHLRSKEQIIRNQDLIYNFFKNDIFYEN
ncbi:guanylate kinase [Candidatus Riesia pediculicola USDA]|uniref:Guanylate kinase n=1 Tax=Riesia pediculicola (strain USDA) TaxID=515618 RepID=D4G7V8_RIEPU|nr:guanylate kinase [Candidatus Riesia pediculicola]ADD79512.1 guanylate kinase [Candidatus Riesia pediculicola USDA]